MLPICITANDVEVNGVTKCFIVDKFCFGSTNTFICRCPPIAIYKSKFLLFCSKHSKTCPSCCLNVFNIPNEEIEYMIDLRKPIYGLSNSEELQGIAFYEGGVYVSTSLWETYPNNAYCNLYRVSF